MATESLQGNKWSNSDGWEPESTLEPLSGFEPKTPRLGIQPHNHIAPN